LEKFNIAIDEETSAVAELTMTWNIIDPIDIDESKKLTCFSIRKHILFFVHYMIYLALTISLLRVYKYLFIFMRELHN
jgi:hypothetical protein